MKKNLMAFLLCIVAFVFAGNTFVVADGGSTFKKNRIKQLSKISDRYNYYEEKNNKVSKYSGDLGIDARKLKGYGRVQNWVEIDNSDVGSVTKSATKRIKSINPFRNKKKDSDPDNNLGIIVDYKKSNNIDNTVIIKDSKIENALLGADVNTGITIKKSKGRIQRKKYTNEVIIDNSRVGGAVGLFQ